MAPVNTFTKSLRPSETYATRDNQPTQWLWYMVTRWQNNGLPGLSTEQYSPGSAAAGSLWDNMVMRNAQPTYDGLNRLTGLTDTDYKTGAPNWSRNYWYDEMGNMAVSGAAGVPPHLLTPQVDSTNPVNPYHWDSNRLSYATFDNAGNMRAVSQNGVSLNFQYDPDGEMTQVQDGSHTLMALYDAEGNRVRKILVGGETRVYVHDAFGVLAAEYSSTPPSATLPCKTCYLNYDYLGSVRMVTDENGTVVSRHDYLPYGEEIPAGTAGRSTSDLFGMPDGVSARFTGQARDGEVAPAVDYFNARMFSAALGTFTRPDPGSAGADLANPQSWNGYGYVGGNPLLYTDPSGESFLSILKGIAAAIAIVFSVLATHGVGGALVPHIAAWAAWASGGAQIGSLIGSSTPSVWSEQAPGLGSASVNTGSVYGSGDSGPFIKNILKPVGDTSAINLENYNRGLDYLRRDPWMALTIRKLESSSTVYEVRLNRHGDDSASSYAVNWDPFSSLLTTENVCQSAALGLGHELSHVARSPLLRAVFRLISAGPYGNIEEQLVTNGIEARTAKTLGEPRRFNHGGTPTLAPSSTARECK